MDAISQVAEKLSPCKGKRLASARIKWASFPTVRECKAMGLEKEGMCLYIKAFRDEAEAAEAGMGAMFG